MNKTQFAFWSISHLLDQIYPVLHGYSKTQLIFKDKFLYKTGFLLKFIYKHILHFGKNPT
jgi:hypothetical protein